MPITNVSFSLVCGDANDARRESVEKGERMRLQVESEMGEKQEVGPNQQEFGRSFATCVTRRMPREIPAVKLGPIETGEERMSPDVIYSARATTQREQQQIRCRHVRIGAVVVNATVTVARGIINPANMSHMSQ